MMKLSTEYLLTLLKTPKIGQVSVKYINSNIDYKLSGIKDLYDAILELKIKNPKLPAPKLGDIEQAYDDARRTYDVCENLNIKAISCNNENYPFKLKRLDDFPVIIYIKGSITSINSYNSVAIIGTREPSDFGFRAGKRISGIFAENDFTVISGLAIGCDTSGHLGAVEKNKPTVAVLASGVDIIYPKENKGLSERIIETGGALLSEYEPGTRTFPQQFVQRDRIQSGLADGLIVIETGIKGGTMHAVSAAKKIAMPIACLTGHPQHLSDFDKIKGNNFLIEGGASSLGNSGQINSFILKLNPDITLKNTDSKIIAGLPEHITVPAPKPDSDNSQKLNISLPSPYSELEAKKISVHNDEKVEVHFENIEQKFLGKEPQLNEIKELILKLTEEQRETNKLLKILVSQLPKEKNSKKKADNQSSFL